MTITKAMLEKDVVELEKQLEATKSECIHAIGVATGRLNTVRAQVAFLEAEEKKSSAGSAAAGDVADHHANRDLAKVVSGGAGA